MMRSCLQSPGFLAGRYIFQNAGVAPEADQIYLPATRKLTHSPASQGAQPPESWGGTAANEILRARILLSNIFVVTKIQLETAVNRLLPSQDLP
jgi:hypothetical protein